MLGHCSVFTSRLLEGRAEEFGHQSCRGDAGDRWCNLGGPARCGDGG